MIRVRGAARHVTAEDGPGAKALIRPQAEDLPTGPAALAVGRVEQHLPDLVGGEAEEVGHRRRFRPLQGLAQA